MNAFTSRRNILRNLNSSYSIADLSIAPLSGLLRLPEQPAKPLPKIVPKVPIPTKTAPTPQPPSAEEDKVRPSPETPLHRLRPFRRRTPQAGGCPPLRTGSPPSTARTVTPTPIGPGLPNGPGPADPNRRPPSLREGRPRQAPSRERVTRSLNGGEINRAANGRVSTVRATEWISTMGPGVREQSSGNAPIARLSCRTATTTVIFSAIMFIAARLSYSAPTMSNGVAFIAASIVLIHFA